MTGDGQTSHAACASPASPECSLPVGVVVLGAMVGDLVVERHYRVLALAQVGGLARSVRLNGNHDGCEHPASLGSGTSSATTEAVLSSGMHSTAEGRAIF